MPHSLDCAVVQIDMRLFHMGGKRLRIDCESVILRSDGHFAGAQIFYRLVRSAMAEFQFERRSAEREAQNLMAETDPEDRSLAHQILHGFVGIRERRRVARAIGEKNPVWIKSHYFVRGCCCWNNSHLETFLAQKPQNVFLNSIVIRGDPKANSRKRRFAAFTLWMSDRPRRAVFVIRIPAVNFLC